MVRIGPSIASEKRTSTTRLALSLLSRWVLGQGPRKPRPVLRTSAGACLSQLGTKADKQRGDNGPTPDRPDGDIQAYPCLEPRRNDYRAGLLCSVLTERLRKKALTPVTGKWGGYA